VNAAIERKFIQHEGQRGRKRKETFCPDAQKCSGKKEGKKCGTTNGSGKANQGKASEIKTKQSKGGFDEKFRRRQQ